MKRYDGVSGRLSGESVRDGGRRLTGLSRLIAPFLLLISAIPAGAQVPTARYQPPPFTEKINYGDCRDWPAPCVQDPWTGNMSISPHLIREGESITITFALEPGGVSFTMPGGGKGCDYAKESRPTEVQNSAGTWVLQDKDVATSGTCTLKPGPTGGHWSTMQVGVTGPCGSEIAVQQGRAEFAACTGTYASDYYGVIAKDDDRYGISGRVTLSNGRPMVGVPISVSGPDSQSTTTGAGGSYSFLVKKGDYTVSAGAKVCVTPGPADQCSQSKQVTVPESQTVNFMPPGEGVIRGTVLGEDSKPKAGVDVHIVGPDGITVQSDSKGQYEARLPKGEYTVAASFTSTPALKPGEKGPALPKVDTYCADDHGTFPKQCRKSVTVTVPPDQNVNSARQADPNDIQVDLSGKEVVKGKKFVITLNLENPRDRAIENVKFVDGAGLGIESLIEFSGAPVVASTTENPPTLPTRFNAKQTISLKFFYDAPNPGQVVMTTNVSGTDENDKSAVKGTAAISVSAGRPITKDDIDRKAVDDIAGILSVTAEKQRQLDKMMAANVARQAEANKPSDADIALAAELGTSVEVAKALNQQQAERDAFWSSYGTEFANEVDKRGKAGGQFISSVVSTLEDPEGRRQLAESIVEGGKKFGKSSWENLGYLGQAYGAAYTLDGVKNIIDYNTKMAGDVATSLDQARVGYGEISKQDAIKYKNDPIAFQRENAKQYATASVTGVQEAMLAALGEVGVRGIAAVAPKVLEVAGLRRVEAVTEGATESSGATAATTDAVAGADELAAAERRLANAEKAFQTLQELPEGKILSDAELLAQGGIRTEDANLIHDIIGDVEKKFHVQIEVGARTSEPLSAGIDGVGKREFIKPKAISALDKILGGEESLAGRASVFEPKMPSPEVLQGLEAKVPNITKKLEARFADQKKLWDEYQDANSSLRQIIKGSGEVKDAQGKLRGVTAMVERPGSTFPSELGKVKGQPSFAYLEQLDDTAFLEGRGISPDRAAELKSQLSKFPDQARTKLEAKVVNGTTTFSEGLSGKPIVSDLDLQFVEPAGGWPPGMKGKVEAYVNARMKESGRFPGHAWSDAAIDVPSEVLEVSGKFKLSTANPALAKAAAEDLARQFKTMAKLLRDKAALTADDKAAFKMLDQAAKFDKITADYLLKKYPAGEKIIIFTKGDARVGYSTGGKK